MEWRTLEGGTGGPLVEASCFLPPPLNNVRISALAYNVWAAAARLMPKSSPFSLMVNIMFDHVTVFYFKPS